jgi:hypothetical protein
VHPAIGVILLDQSDLGENRIDVLLHRVPTDLVGKETGRR